MREIIKILSLSLLIFFTTSSFSQNKPPTSPTKAQMTYMGTFDAGQPGVGIFKMFDPTDGIVCYIMTPENVVNKIIDNKITYEANSIGSISCVKATQPNINNINPGTSSINNKKPTEETKSKEKPADKK